MNINTQIQPRAFFRFAANNCDMLLELYRHCEGQNIQQSQTLQIIRKFATPESSPAMYLLERMCQLGFLEYSPGSDMSYEMPHNISRLLGYLQRKYRLTSAEVIQGYLHSMDRFCEELDKSSQTQDADAAVRVLYEADENIERMRSDSYNNRQRIIAECMDAKINQDKLSVKRRFALINHLYEKYLEPLRDMIDVTKEMDSQLERMQRVFDVGKRAFNIDRHVRPLIERSSDRLLRLKRGISSDFRESYRELMPLYKSYRKENMIASGAANALKLMNSQGINKLELSAKLGLFQFRSYGLISDSNLEAYVYGISDYRPHEVIINPDKRTDKNPDFISVTDIKQLLVGVRKIDDVLKWILQKFSTDSLTQHLRIYGMFHFQLTGNSSFASNVKEYNSGGTVLKAHPMSFKVGEYE